MKVHQAMMSVNIVQHLSKTDATWYLFRLGIFTLPYDAIRNILPSTYRPISIYFFAGYFLVSLIQKKYYIKLKKTVFYLLGFALYVVVSSLILTPHYTGDFSLYGEFVVTFITGLTVFFACYLGFFTIAKGKSIQEYCYEFFRILGQAYTISIWVGVIDALSVYGVLPHYIKTIINTIFGGNQTNRLTITTFEASWVSMHMAFASCIFLYLALRHKHKYKVRCVIAMLLFWLSASMQGFLTVALGCIIWIFYYSYVEGIVLKSIKLSIVLIISFIVTFFTLRIFFSSLSPSYFTTRFLNFTSFNNLIRTDGSSFLRIEYPMIGLLMFKDHLLFGMGGGSFSYIMSDYIQKYYQWAVGFPEVSFHIATRNTASAVSLYTRVFGENGLIGVCLFFGFIISCLKYGKRLKHLPFMNIVLLLICVTITFGFQFSSYAFTLIWVILAFLLNLPLNIFSGIKFINDRKGIQ